MALVEILLFLALANPGNVEALAPAYHNATGAVYYQSIDGFNYSSFSPRTLAPTRGANWCDRWHGGPYGRGRNVYHGGRYGWRGSRVGSFYFPRGRAGYGYYGRCGPYGGGYSGIRGGHYGGYRSYGFRGHRGSRGGYYGGYRCFRRPIIYVARY